MIPKSTENGVAKYLNATNNGNTDGYMKIVVFTLGCKVNRSESDSLIRALRNDGHEVTDELVPADLYIVNTCAVTGEAEKKSRQTSARIAALNPSAKIIYTGCASENSPESFIKKGNASLVTGTFKKGDIPKMLREEGIKKSLHDETFEELLPVDSLRARTYVKIQDGCNNFCSYCLIPYLRGRSRSRNPESIINEIKQTNPTECVINGINISDYDYNGVNLAGLVRMLKDFDTRFRFGSIEANVIDDELLSACKELKNFAPHFHLSLQSGANAVLKKMNRHYTTDEYYEKVLLIRRYFKYAGITTDIIAGFPTETDEDAAETAEFVKKVGFSDIHPFPFSMRKGTACDKLKMQDLSGDIKKARTDELIALKKVCRENFENLNIGRTLTVLTETVEDGYISGYSENYIKIYLKGDGLKENEFYKVKALSRFKDGLLAETIE